MRLLVEVPAQSFELSLTEVHSLRANLHRRPKKSNFALMRVCYARLHGVNPAYKLARLLVGLHGSTHPAHMTRPHARW